MPVPSTRQSHMSVHMGKSAAVDDNHQIDNLAFKMNVLAKTADYTILPSESGSIFTNRGATAAVNFTLPADADGLVYYFAVIADFELKVTCDTADTMVDFNDVAADSVAYTTASEHIGGGLMVFNDGTQWVVLAMPYGLGATAQTVTVGT